VQRLAVTNIVVEAALKDGMAPRDAVFHAANIVSVVKSVVVGFKADVHKQADFWEHIHDASQRNAVVRTCRTLHRADQF
jgi:hypothetical protein